MANVDIGINGFAEQIAFPALAISVVGSNEVVDQPLIAAKVDEATKNAIPHKEEVFVDTTSVKQEFTELQQSQISTLDSMITNLTLEEENYELQGSRALKAVVVLALVTGLALLFLNLYCPVLVDRFIDNMLLVLGVMGLSYIVVKLDILGSGNLSVQQVSHRVVNSYRAIDTYLREFYYAHANWHWRSPQTYIYAPRLSPQLKAKLVKLLKYDVPSLIKERKRIVTFYDSIIKNESALQYVAKHKLPSETILQFMNKCPERYETIIQLLREAEIRAATNLPKELCKLIYEYSLPLPKPAT